MTDTTDAVVGTIPGLLAVGIMANVAGKMMGGSNRRQPRARPLLQHKPRSTLKIGKIKHSKHKHKLW